MKFKYAVFDMDGTLLDTMDYWRNVVHYYAEMHGLPAPQLTDEDAIEASHLPTYKKIAYLKEHYGDQKAVKQIQSEDVFDVMEHFYKKAPNVKSGVKEMLDTLKNNGVRMCVASATPSYLIKTALHSAGLEEYFEFVLSPDEYPKGKSEPDIFYGIAERFGCKVTDVTLFEDALYSIKTAHSLGMYIVAVCDKYSAYQADEIKKYCNEYHLDFTDYKYN